MKRLLILLLGLTVGVSAKSISLTTAKFDPLKDGEPQIPLHLKATEKGLSLYIVQFKGPITKEWKHMVKNEGAEICGYVPYFALLVRMDATVKKKIEKFWFVRWIGLYHPYYKISPEFQNLKQANGKGSYSKDFGWHSYSDPLYVNFGNLQSMVLYALPYVDWSEVSNIVNSLGGEVKSITGAPPGRMIIWAPPAVIEELAKIDGIYYISPYKPKNFLNNTTLYVVQSDVLTVQPNNTPLTGGDTVIAGKLPLWDRNIKGQGQLITVMDTGVDYYSCWFRDPEGDPPGPNHIVIEDYTNEGGDLQDTDICAHGTHVTGTVAGDPTRGGANTIAEYRGNAYLGRIYMQDIGVERGVNCNLSITNFYNSAGIAYSKGSRIHTNSWGYTGDGSYQYEAIDIDVFTFVNQDMIFTVAAGNDGPASNTVGPPSTAKNCISVGSTYRESYDSSADTLSDFSSRGPTDDGRYKPDLTAPGGRYPPAGPRGDWREYIVSAYPNSSWGTPSCQIGGMMGTSMATPAVAAAAALVRQYYMEGWYPTGTQNAADAFNPSGALVKATLIVSCEDMSGDDNGVDNPIPNFEEGFGRIKLDSALYFQGDEPQRLAILDVASLVTGQADTYVITVNSALRPFRMALVWYDTAAAALANPTLINDLDLILIDPNGTEYHGNQMTNAQSDPNPAGFDRINTVEFFQLSSPVTGDWIVIIQAFQVVTGKPQSYAVAATGDISTFNLLGYAEYVGYVTSKNSRNGVILKWSGGVSPYTIERKKEGSEYIKIASGIRQTEFIDDKVKNGTTYEYKILDGRGMVVGKTKITFKLGIDFLLSPRPTVFKSGEKIKLAYSIAAESEVIFKVYNTNGRLVARIVAGKKQPGVHFLIWDGRDENGKLIPAGKYFIRMFANGIVGQRAFIVVE